MKAGLLLFGFPFLFACVNGGDDSTTKPQGSLGGSCFANNTCNAGLDCVLQNGSGICEQADATTASDAPSDQSVADTGPVDTGADVPSDACTSTLAPTLSCTGGCLVDAGLAGCCEKTALCVATATACSPYNPWTCQTGADCTNGFHCCVTLSLNPTCPPSGSYLSTSAGASCQGSCGTGEVATCTKLSDCPSNQLCVGTQIDSINTPIGVCTP